MILKKLALFGVVGLAMLSGGVAAAKDDVAPAPRRMPRTPVQREPLLDRNKVAIPPSRNVTGSATIVDTERVKIGDLDMRLFGIVPPQLSATFGPQARAVLDSLTAVGAVSCTIRDRDRDSRFLATCRNAAGADLALELLRRGLAVSARGSLRPTELAGPYIASEQAAQTQKLGLWSMSLPKAASEASIREAAIRNEAAAKADAPPALEPKAKEEPPKAEAKAEPQNDPTPIPVSVVIPDQQNKEASASPKVDQLLPYLMPLETPQVSQQAVAERGFFERYQLLITGILMLLTALGVVAAVFYQRWRDRQEELRSIAAALRGELMAARAICQARLSSIAAGTEDKNISWPRIRTLVFQAYVGRIGALGSVLARQIASIYGQASDYAAYYSSSRKDEAKGEGISKRHAIRALMGHIEEVLPKLAGIEEHSLLPSLPKIAMPSSSHVAALPPPPLEIAKPHVEAKKDDAVTPEPAVEKAEQTEKEEPVIEDMAAATVTLADEAKTPVEKPAPLWDSIRKFATERLVEHSNSLSESSTKSMEDHIPDYTALSEEEELEALSYGGDLDDIEEIIPVKPKRKRKAG